MKKQTVAFSKNSSNLFFHILTKCNLSCRHCYINTEQHGTNTLSIETIKEWLYLFAQFSKKSEQINVIFLGGEPTLHPDLAIAIKEARRLGFKSITIDTNGYLFHNILEKITPDDVDFISFSLDGATEETNDFIRGKGSYQTVIAGIKKAVDLGFSTSMIYTVSSDNLHELALMPNLLKSLLSKGAGIERFFIQVVGIRGSSADKSKTSIDEYEKNKARDEKIETINRQVSKESWLETVPEVAHQVAQLGITVTYPKVFLEDTEKFECAGVVADNYFIFPNGRVYRCPLCEDYPLHSIEIIGSDRVIAPTLKINESDLFELNIPEGCVMNKLIQPGNLEYNSDGTPCYKIACCMLKEEISKS
ncbi:MAG: radical SAM protein [Desulfamplus sp.]|nr:radical SAM protein [Desulfamplus sp.]MBF0412369.1 radical SAM protein [Desulfamplus sp.]